MRDRGRANRRKRPATWIAAAMLLLTAPQALPSAADFEEDLARVDRALRENPSKVPALALRSCRSRRDAAIRYFEMGRLARAEHGLEYCIRILKIPESER